MTLTAEILATGDELLRGDVVNTNASWLAGRLLQLGVTLQRVVVVGDPLAEIRQAVTESLGRCDVLVVSGGLGPTDDDRTTEAVAQACGTELEVRPEALEALRQWCARAGITLPAQNDRQARLPRGADLLLNARGTAPGFGLTCGRCRVFCLPGVPSEMKAMFDEQVAPWFSLSGPCAPVRVRSINVFGLGESHLEERLEGFLQEAGVSPEQVSVHFRTSFPENRLVLVARGSDPEAVRLLDRLEAGARARVGRFVFGTDQTTFSQAVVDTLRQAGATVALAESCTGGLAGDLITRAAGSSDVFELGIVSYSNRIKQQELGVSQEILDTQGAVSQACVEAMAQGVRQKAGATLGVAISGIAGPGGGTPLKPVGTVHFALASEQGLWHLHRVFSFGRQKIKTLSAHFALAMVLAHLRAGSRAPEDPLDGRWRPRNNPQPQTSEEP